MKTQWILTLAILAIGGAIAGGFYYFQPEAETSTPERSIPKLETLQAKPMDLDWWIPSQGEVQAAVETELSAETTGRIVSVHEAFEAGGVVRKGETLVKLENLDARRLLQQRKLELEQARVSLAREREQAKQARRDWERAGRGEPTDLVLRKPQLRQAKAALQSARASLKQARRDLQRTTVKAPYDARIVQTFVDQGQYIDRAGTRLARIYKKNSLEVRLPLEARDYALIGVPGDRAGGIPVRLQHAVRGNDVDWKAKLVRTEAEVDARNRMYHVVAQIEMHSTGSEALPLLPGVFVQAHIRAKPLKEAFRIPDFALLDRNTVLVVDEKNKLHRRDVEVIYADFQWAIVTSGLKAGDQVVVTPVEFVAEGMQVEPKRVNESDVLKMQQSDASTGEGALYFGKPPQRVSVEWGTHSP